MSHCVVAELYFRIDPLAIAGYCPFKGVPIQQDNSSFYSIRFTLLPDTNAPNTNALESYDIQMLVQKDKIDRTNCIPIMSIESARHKFRYLDTEPATVTRTDNVADSSAANAAAYVAATAAANVAATAAAIAAENAEAVADATDAATTSLPKVATEGLDLKKIKKDSNYFNKYMFFANAATETFRDEDFLTRDKIQADSYVCKMDIDNAAFKRSVTRPNVRNDWTLVILSSLLKKK